MGAGVLIYILGIVLAVVVSRFRDGLGLFGRLNMDKESWKWLFTLVVPQVVAQWLRRTFNAPGLTQVPQGPYVDQVKRRAGRTVRVRRRQDPDSVGPYTVWAGQNQITGPGSDQYGNAYGSDYDLVEDGSIIEATVVALNLCPEVNLEQPKVALERKGFTLVELRDGTRLAEEVGRCRGALGHLGHGAALITLSTRYSRVLFQRRARSLHLGRQRPYFADANLVLERLFRTVMFGNSPGDQVVSIRTAEATSGLVPGHLVTTGLTNIFEGITIAEVPTTELLRPLVYGSNGRVLTAYYDNDVSRAIVDGGFTRLYYKWDSAGTDRYIVNAAAWLLNIERFE